MNWGDRHSQLHPVHPDECFMPGGNAGVIQAPGHWLILAGLICLSIVVLVWLAPIDLGSAAIQRTVLALAATLAVGAGLVALRRHRHGLIRQPAADPLDSTERLLPLSVPQALFMLLCFAAMTLVLVLTARASLVEAVVTTALFVLLSGALFACVLAAARHAVRWRQARRTFARRHGERDLGYFGVWDRT